MSHFTGTCPYAQMDAFDELQLLLPSVSTESKTISYHTIGLYPKFQSIAPQATVTKHNTLSIFHHHCYPVSSLHIPYVQPYPSQTTSPPETFSLRTLLPLITHRKNKKERSLGLAQTLLNCLRHTTRSSGAPKLTITVRITPSGPESKANSRGPSTALKQEDGEDDSKAGTEGSLDDEVGEALIPLYNSASMSANA